jgi:hypothetical protein
MTVISKERALAIVNEMPQEIDLEVLKDKLVFVGKIQEGLEQVKTNNLISHTEVKQRFKML